MGLRGPGLPCFAEGFTTQNLGITLGQPGEHSQNNQALSEIRTKLKHQACCATYLADEGWTVMCCRILEGEEQGVKWECWALTHTADGTAWTPTSAKLPTAQHSGGVLGATNQKCWAKSGNIKALGLPWMSLPWMAAGLWD